MRLGSGAEQAEDGRAGARHPRQDAAVGAAETGPQFSDHRHQRHSGRLKVVAGFAEPKGKLRGANERIDNANFTLALADRGVRSSVVRLG